MLTIRNKLYRMTEETTYKHKIRKGGVMNMKKNKNKGITLIALIITIIVLLILAGIVLRICNRRRWNDRKSNYC